MTMIVAEILGDSRDLPLLFAVSTLVHSSSHQSVTIARGDGFRCESAQIVSLISYDSNRMKYWECDFV